jgi:calcium-dependent protein kinase
MKIIEMVDINQSGCIDYTEFLVATIKEENILSQQRIEQAFEIIDIVTPL